MHLFGWVSIHNTYQHMGVFEKNFVVGIFGVWIFGLLQLLWINEESEVEGDQEYGEG